MTPIATQEPGAPRTGEQSVKNKLLFEEYAVHDPLVTCSYPMPEQKIAKMRDLGIATVLICTRDAVDQGPFMTLVNWYKNAGFEIRLNFMDSLNRDRYDLMIAAVAELNRCFKKGGCLMISYGKSYALPILSCFYIVRGKNPEDANETAKRLGARSIESDQEIAYIYGFERFLRTGIYEERDMERTSQPVVTTPPPAASPLLEESRIRSLETVAVPESLELETQDIRAREDDGFAPVTDLETLELEPAAPKQPVAMPEPPAITPPEPVLKPEPAIIMAPAPAPAPEPKAAAKPASPAKSETPPPAQKGEAEMKDAQEGSKKGPVDVVPFYSGIRFKLITIISLVIAFSLSGMIVLATYFFQAYNRTQVRESNFKISEVIAQKVEAEIDRSVTISRGMISGVESESNNEVIFAAYAEEAGGRIAITKSAYNLNLMADRGITRAVLTALEGELAPVFARAAQGEKVLVNISRNLQSPTIAICMPQQEWLPGAAVPIIIIYLKLDTILRTFSFKTGVIKAFMVNDKGDILAHSDANVVLGSGNYQSSPIVQYMMKSPVARGETKYLDEEGIPNLGSFKKLALGGGVIAHVSETKAFEEVYSIMRRNFLLMGIIITIATLIVYFFGKSLTTPILRLVGATRQIAEGNFNLTIKPAGRDEIGYLTSTFVQMGKGLEEREKIKTAFGKFVNQEIANAAMNGELKLGGERKNIAIFFSDIRSFTAISEKLEPEEVVEFLNEYMTLMVNCVEKTGGVVDKFIGDAIMAVWGAPVSRGNDTENAVNGALMMRSELMRFNEGRGGDRKPVIRIGCGINSGPALAGQIGSENRMEYTVIGDAVNLASRIESLNKPFGTDVLISSDAYELVRDVFDVVQMQPIKVKGKTEPQHIYAVLGRLDDETRPRSMEELRSRVGIAEPDHPAPKGKAIDIEEGEVKYEILEN